MDKPIVVVLSSEAKVEHQDAYHMIQTWGIEAYPFTFERQRELRVRTYVFHMLGSYVSILCN